MKFQKFKEVIVITREDSIYRYDHVSADVDCDFLRVWEDNCSGTYFPINNIINFTFVVEDDEA